MKKYLLLILVFYFHARAQDYTLRDLLGKEISDCEEVADSSQKHIASLSFSAREDSIYRIMEDWQEVCGFGEPHFRIQTLYLINKGHLSDSILPDDALEFIYRYVNRIDDAQRENFEEVYWYNRNYYDFTPLRSALDDWTRRIADSLLEYGTYDALGQYFLNLYASPTRSQFEKKMFSEEYDSLALAREMQEIKYQEREGNGEFSLYAGYWHWLGPQSQHFGNTGMLGIEYGGAFNEQWRGDLGLQFRIPRTLQDFRVNVTDSTTATTNTFNGCIYFRVARKLWSNKHFYISAQGAAGLDFLVTGAEVIHYDPEEGETVSDLTLYTYNLEIGPEIGIHLFRWHQAGLRFSYHIMNYGQGIKTVSDLRGHAFSAALFYRF